MRKTCPVCDEPCDREVHLENGSWAIQPAQTLFKPEDGPRAHFCASWDDGNLWLYAHADGTELTPENDDRDPIDVLYDIEKKVNAAHDPIAELEPRAQAKPETQIGTTLADIAEKQPAKNADLEVDTADSNVTRLYKMYLVDREKDDGAYQYTVTPLGEKILNKHEYDWVGDDAPWKTTELNKGQYYALKALEELNDATNEQLDKKYCELMAAKRRKDRMPRVSPRMTELFEMGLVNRTPGTPYRYWPTEEGLRVLDD